ncbi:MAG TPA: hypothetical protein VMY37_20650 [Thermoguttaceae bacterium]|nr:hypothetical protein [Thermoguttaceae bacterium]
MIGPIRRNGWDDAARRRAREERARAIVDGARVRRELGQGALHGVAEGEHVVTVGGRRFRGATLDQAIDAAKG